MEEVLKTSQEWYLEKYPEHTLVILDPDGWDRTNWLYSWYEEKISEDTWMERLSLSTVVSGAKVIPVNEMIHGHYYYNRQFSRGMRVGMWDEELKKFMCLHCLGKYQKKNTYEVYQMNHVDNDDGFAVFAPIRDMSYAVQQPEIE